MPFAGLWTSIPRTTKMCIRDRGYIDLSQVENCEKVSYITVDFSTVNDDFTLDYRTQLRDSDEVRGLFEKMQTVWTSFKLNRTMKCVEYMYMILNLSLIHIYIEFVLYFAVAIVNRVIQNVTI